jgi:pimeloyl-ACP methyl ester carboxylesterase
MGEPLKASAVSFGKASSASLTMPSRRNVDEMTTTFRTLSGCRIAHCIATASKGHDFGADKLKATTAPMFFIHGDADGVRLEHVAEMFRLKGGEVHGDMKPRSASRLAILPNTTHVTLMQRMTVIVPMVNDFLDAKP